MAPVIQEINIEDVEPMSRTYQYRKVMKPMLERKRRARINKCLDELKNLMVDALQNDGESISKLEKADVLELTVNHLKTLKKHNALSLPAASHSQEKFNTGFRQCTSEVTKFIAAAGPAAGINVHVSNRLVAHLGGCINELDKFTTGISHSPMQYTSAASPSTSPISVSIPSKMYTPPASPDTTREQVSPSTSTHFNSIQAPSASLQQSSPSYSIDVGNSSVHQQSLLIQSQINRSNISNVTYKVATSQQPQQLHHHNQQLYRQPQPAHQQHPTHHQSPPSPPLSVGSPSPVHHFAQVKKSISPAPTLVSPVVVQARLPANVDIITDALVWRPW